MTIVALAAAALATSCASEDIAEPQKQKQNQNQGGTRTVTLTASVAGDDNTTRVGMTNSGNNKASFYWQNGDAISVLTLGKTGYSAEKLTTTDADGTQTATFKGTLKGNMVGYALYPHNDKHSFSTSTGAVLPTVTYILPASYEYTTVDSNIFSKTTDDGTTYPSNPTNMPMYGSSSSSSDKSIEFKHIGGLAVIRVDRMPAESGTLTVTADQQLSGGFKVSGLPNNPNIATASTDTDADKTVTFTFSGAIANGVGVFYLPLATGDYTNLTITIAYGEDNATTQAIPYGSLSVARAGVTAIPLSTDSKGNLRYCVKNSDGSYTINGHKFVDLGLSVLWAETNIGAETAYDGGNYYAWGETAPKSSYSESTYTTLGKYTESLEYTKYTSTDGNTVLELEDDAAYANWGSGCRMPTKAEFEDLVNSCTWTLESEAIKRYKVASNNNNVIYIPLPGYGVTNGSINGEYGHYWSSTLSTDDIGHAYFLNLNSGNHSVIYKYFDRYFGHSVRPVAEKPTE